MLKKDAFKKEATAQTVSKIQETKRASFWKISDKTFETPNASLQNDTNEKLEFFYPYTNFSFEDPLYSPFNYIRYSSQTCAGADKGTAPSGAMKNFREKMRNLRKLERWQLAKIFSADTFGNNVFSLITGIGFDILSGLNLKGIAASRGSAALANSMTGGAYGIWRDFLAEKINHTPRLDHWMADKFGETIGKAPRAYLSELIAFVSAQPLIYGTVLAIGTFASEGAVNFPKVFNGMMNMVYLAPFIGPAMGYFMDLVRKMFNIREAGKGAYTEAKNIHDMFNENCTPYDKHMRNTGHYRAQKRLLKRIQRHVNVSKSVLDAGCGTGSLYLTLAEIGCEKMLGNDFAANMNIAMRKRFEKIPVLNEIPLTHENAETLKGYAPGIGTIICCNLLFHLTHQEKAIRRWEKLLNPGGKLIFLEEDPFVYPVGELGEELKKTTFRFKTHGQIRELAEKAGLKVVETASVPIDSQHRLYAIVAQKKDIN